MNVRYAGKIVGRYYDKEGNPTKYLKGVEAKAARGAQLMEKQKIEEAKLPSCNSRWSQEEGSEVPLLLVLLQLLPPLLLLLYQCLNTHTHKELIVYVEN